MSSKDLGTTAFAQFDDRFNGHYRGEVINNLDPLEKGRIQVQVLPMLKGVESTLLPWAIPANPLFSGAGNNSGSFAVPSIGSWVWLFFEEGSIYQPVYFAEASDGVHGVLADSTTNYPNRKIIRTPNGVEVIIDDTALSYTIKHPTGTYIQVATNGSVIVNSIDAVIIQGTTVSINPQ